MKKKTVSLLLVAAMAVGMLAGCGGGKSSISQDGSSDAAEGNEKAEMADAKDVDGTTITFWHSMGGVNGQAIDTLVKKFNDENEYGITVEAQYQGEYDDSLNKLKSAQIGNMGADLVQVYEIGTRFMIESGWTVPMQEMIDADNYQMLVDDGYYDEDEIMPEATPTPTPEPTVTEEPSEDEKDITPTPTPTDSGDKDSEATDTPTPTPFEKTEKGSEA